MIVAHAKEMNDGPRLDPAHTARPFVFVPKTDKSRIEPRTSCNARSVRDPGAEYTTCLVKYNKIKFFLEYLISDFDI
jgi:hypothetical protein